MRNALGRACPVCHGDGRLPLRAVRVSNVREQGIKRLSRAEAQQLQRIYRLGQQVAATRIDLTRLGRRIGFSLRRDRQEILEGVLGSEAKLDGDGIRDHETLSRLQRHGVCWRVPQGLHPGAPSGLRSIGSSESAIYRSGRVHRLQCLRVRMPLGGYLRGCRCPVPIGTRRGAERHCPRPPSGIPVSRACSDTRPRTRRPSKKTCDVGDSKFRHQGRAAVSRTVGLSCKNAAPGADVAPSQCRTCLASP